MYTSRHTPTRLAITIQARQSVFTCYSHCQVMEAAHCMVISKYRVPGRCFSYCLLPAANTTQTASANGGRGGNGMTG